MFVLVNITELLHMLSNHFLKDGKWWQSLRIYANNSIATVLITLNYQLKIVF